MSEAEVSPKKGSKKSTGPRKPRSAFAFFGEATRAELTEAMPDIQIETLTKLIGEEWKKLSDDAKAPYMRQAEEDQARYARGMGAAGLAAAPPPKRKKPAAAASSSAPPSRRASRSTHPRRSGR